MSCLFDSLSHFIEGTSDEIRNIICNYLEENKPIIDGIDTKFILSLDNDNYINNMRHSSTWGGAVEIQAACNIWKTRIIVINKRTNKNTYIEFLPVNNSYKYTINLEWNGSHYEPSS